MPDTDKPPRMNPSLPLLKVNMSDPSFEITPVMFAVPVASDSSLTHEALKAVAGRAAAKV
jgi:hypothetical protein